MPTKYNPRVTFLERDHPLAIFIWDSYHGSSIEDTWLMSALHPALIKLGTLRFGDVFKFNDFKLSNYPKQTGDDLLTLELVPDQYPTSTHTTLYAFESNVKSDEGKGMTFYILAARLGFDVGITPKRKISNAILPNHKFKLPHSGLEVELKVPDVDDLTSATRDFTLPSIPREHLVAKVAVVLYGQSLYSDRPYSATDEEVIKMLADVRPIELKGFPLTLGTTYRVEELFVRDELNVYKPLTVNVEIHEHNVYRIKTNIRHASSPTGLVEIMLDTGYTECLMARKGEVNVDHPDMLYGSVREHPAQAPSDNEWVVKLPGQQNLPPHITFNPVTKSYYKYKITPSEGMVPPERELVTFIDVEVNPNSSKVLRGWNLEELEAIVKNLKEQSNEHHAESSRPKH